MPFPGGDLRAWKLGRVSLPDLGHKAWDRFNENELMTRASGIAFYAMLALVPFLGLILTLAVRLLPDLTGRSKSSVGIGNMTVEQLNSTLQSLFPTEAYDVIKDQIARIQGESPVGLISLGLVITIWLASSLSLAVIDAMNRIYGVRETRPFWKLRLMAIAMTIIQAMLLVGSLLAIVAWPQILRWLGWSWHAALLATVIRWIVVVALVLLGFALSYYIGPDCHQKWRWITPGSILGTCMFLVVSYGFRVYVQNFGNYNKTYGSLGGVMVLLFWFWLSSLILLCAVQIDQIIDESKRKDTPSDCSDDRETSKPRDGNEPKPAGV